MTLLKNSGWNLLGTAVSALAMIPAMAYVARQLDVEAFGLLTLLLGFFGYATVLDGGVARAVIREVALNRANMNVAARVVGTGFWIVLVLGILSAGLLICLSHDFVVWLNVTRRLTTEAWSAFDIAAWIVVPLLLTAVWVAPVEGQGRFRALNIVRGMGYLAIFGFLSFAVWLEPTLYSAVLGLLFGRIFMALIAFVTSCKTLGLVPLYFDRPALVRLYHFGGWLTVSNVVSPVMDYFDRFVVSSIAGADKVAYYSGPAEMIAKFLTVPHAVSRALFPYLSSKSGDGASLRHEFSTPFKVQWLIGVIVLLLSWFFGDWLMGAWLGEGFAENSGPIFKILALGYLFYSLMLVPFTALQAAGHSKLTALVYLIELPIYLTSLVAMIHADGIRGAAIVWVAKTLFELLVFSWLSRKYLMNAVSS